jgi:DNA-binding transcriptional LysR family regulator
MLSPMNTVVSRLRFRHLRLLVALEEHGSLLRAAEQVALTQPGASKALHEIETMFGVPLFARTNRGLEPTEAGHCVIRYARLMQSDLSHLHEEMTAVTSGQGGRLSVGVIMGAVPFLTEALSRVLAKQPSLSVEIVEDTSARLLSLVDDGRLDLAICRTTVSSRAEHYASTVVREETLAVVAHRDHPLAAAVQVTLPDLADFRWVVYTANMPMRLLLEREFGQAGLRFPRELLETTSAFTTLSLLQSNPSFIALVSIDVARFCEKFGLTRILPLTLGSKSEPYELVTLKRNAPTQVVGWLIEEIVSMSAWHAADGR